MAHFFLDRKRGHGSIVHFCCETRSKLPSFPPCNRRQCPIGSLRLCGGARSPKKGQTDMEAIGQFMPLILIFAIMYFLLIRPQQKKVKEHAGNG